MSISFLNYQLDLLILYIQNKKYLQVSPKSKKLYGVINKKNFS